MYSVASPSWFAAALPAVGGACIMSERMNGRTQRERLFSSFLLICNSEKEKAVDAAPATPTDGQFSPPPLPSSRSSPRRITTGFPRFPRSLLQPPTRRNAEVLYDLLQIEQLISNCKSTRKQCTECSPRGFADKKLIGILWSAL